MVVVESIEEKRKRVKEPAIVKEDGRDGGCCQAVSMSTGLCRCTAGVLYTLSKPVFFTFPNTWRRLCANSGERTMSKMGV